MRFSSLVDRINGAGAAAWDIHNAAVEAKRQGRDVIFASVGDPDFDTPAIVTQRAVQALQQGDTHYTDVTGRPALRAAIAAHLNRVNGLSCGPDNIVVTGGAQNALFGAALCLFEAGNEVILLEPAYVTYEATFALTGATLVRVAMPAETGFRIDPAAIRAAITPRTRAIAFANPNNPTGVVMSQAEIEQIAALAIEHDLWVLADEVYGSLVFDTEHRSIGALPGMAERTVTIGSLSKSHAMTGWRTGWAAGPRALIAHMDRLILNMLYGLPGFIQEAALVAIGNYESVTAGMRERYRQRRAIVLDGLSNIPGVSVLSPQAGMFVLLDVRQAGTAPIDLAWAIFRETGVSLLDASAFGAVAHGFLRLTFALGDDDLREACRRIRAFMLER